jgi:hypothetical protein
MNDLTPKEQAKSIVKKFMTVIVEEIIASDKIFKYTAIQCSIKFQEGLIENLKSRSIVSEYENEVLKQLESHEKNSY